MILHIQHYQPSHRPPNAANWDKTYVVLNYFRQANPKVVSWIVIRKHRQHLQNNIVNSRDSLLFGHPSTPSIPLKKTRPKYSIISDFPDQSNNFKQDSVQQVTKIPCHPLDSSNTEKCQISWSPVHCNNTSMKRSMLQRPVP